MAAPKTIKGITIEIAGDTKKLGTALKSIDDQSQELAANLRYVDKLLDFDPGNTELLAEKQKMLADAVENTGERLEALKEVQDQVARQYQSGEIGQRAYLDFQYELSKTEKKLESLKSESQKVERSLDDTGNEARDAGKDLGKLGKDAGGAAGELDDLDSGLGDLVSTIKGLGIGAAIGGVVAKVGEITEESREYREEMAKLDIAYESSRLTAEDAEIAYEKLYRVLGETDQSVEAAQQIALLADSTQDVVRWASVAPGLVARFGDALQPETFFEGANETLKLNEATGAYVQLLEQSGIITVEKFNENLQALNTNEEKQQYMLEVTEQILGDAALAYEERNAQVRAARDADREWEDAMSKVGELLEPLGTDLKNWGSGLVNEWFVPFVGTAIDVGKGLGETFSQLPGDLQEIWDEFAPWWATKWANFAQAVKNLDDTIGNTVGNTVDTAEMAEQELGQNAAAMTTIVTELSDNMSLAAYGVYDPWIGAGATVADVCDGMAQSYNEAVTYIEKQKWHIPKPKVPKISVRGEFSVNPPKAPKFEVAWNARGGIFASPMVLPAMDGSLQGFGEAGQEAILPLNSFYEQLERIVDRRSGPQSIVFEPHLTVYQQAGEDGEALAQRAAERMMDMFYEEVGAFG